VPYSGGFSKGSSVWSDRLVRRLVRIWSAFQFHKRPVEPARNGVEVIGEEARKDVEGHGGGGVPEHQLNRFDVGAGCYSKAGCGVAHLVRVSRLGVRQHLVMRDPLVIHVVRHGRIRSSRVGLVMGWADESIEPDQHDAAVAVAARLAAAPAPVRSCRVHSPGPVIPQRPWLPP
jgi:hypothetical protein